MRLIAQIHDTQAQESELDEFSRRLTKSLNDQPGLEASAEAADHLPGQKGGYELAGQIILTLIGTGGVVSSLITVLRAYVEQKTTVKVELTRSDGAKLVLQASNLKPNELNQTTDTLTNFLKA